MRSCSATARTGVNGGDPASTSRAFRHLRNEAGLDHVRVHDLRHLVATCLLASGIDVRNVSGRLGRSLTSTRLNVSAAFVPEWTTGTAR